MQHLGSRSHEGEILASRASFGAICKHGNVTPTVTIDALRGSGNPDTPPSAEKGEQA